MSAGNVLVDESQTFHCDRTWDGLRSCALFPASGEFYCPERQGRSVGGFHSSMPPHGKVSLAVKRCSRKQVESIGSARAPYFLYSFLLIAVLLSVYHLTNIIHRQAVGIRLAFGSIALCAIGCVC